MFSWWLNRPTEEDRVQDENSNLEPPETPAPVFAARALKSAFFGTPGGPGDDATIEVETKSGTIAGKDTQASQHRNTSPTKPPGILLTPGTATARRKTVSFGTEVSDNEKITKGEKTTDGETTEKNEQDSLPPKLLSSHRANRKTPLMRSLERAKDAKARKSSLEQNRSSSNSQQPLINLGQDLNNFEVTAAIRPKSTEPSTSSSSNQELLQELVTGDENDRDLTVDLNEPHSQSGRYWKSEYEQYHNEATAEMQKLVRFKQLAKSYAQKKDAEKVELTEKLKEEQHRVTTMEDRISKLSAQVTAAGFDGDGGECSELVKELARQTALALQYKTQVEEFRVTLEGTTGQSLGGGVAPLQTDETLGGTRRELRIAREQLKDVASLRQEMRDLRQALSSAERTSSKLQAENAKLTQELLKTDLRLEAQREKSEKRRQETEEQLQKKVEAFKSLQQDYNTLKEKMKAQRGEAESILREKHEQAVRLRKELASLKRDTAMKAIHDPLQRNSLEEERNVTRSQQPPAEMEDHFGGRSAKDTDVVGEAAQAQKKPGPRNSHHATNISKTRDGLIPVMSPSTSGPSKGEVYLRPSLDVTPRKSPSVQVPHAALSEVVNHATLERLPFERTGPVAHTPLTHRVTSLSGEIPNMELPSPEPSLSQITGYKAHEKKFQPSPRPSMFTFTASPPKADRWRTRTSDDLPRHWPVSNAAEGDPQVVSTRLSSSDGSRPRSTLPPDRAAAARARLEKKIAERKRVQGVGTGKENIPN